MNENICSYLLGFGMPFNYILRIVGEKKGEREKEKKGISYRKAKKSVQKNLSQKCQRECQNAPE